jgi:hypothetical protein
MIAGTDAVDHRGDGHKLEKIQFESSNICVKDHKTNDDVKEGEQFSHTFKMIPSAMES